MTLNEFFSVTDKCNIVAIKHDSKIVGGMLIYCNEVHCCVDPELKGKWFGRVALRVINEIIDKYGEVISRATTEDGHKILIALGFRQDGEIYRSTKKWALKHY